MKNKQLSLNQAGDNTRLAHLGHDPSSFHGFVNPPVVHGSTVLFPDCKTMETRGQKYTYGTRGTPTTDALCDALNELEGAAGTILVPSGLAAITVPFLAYLSAGDHALIVDSVYSPCRHFCNTMLARLGVEVEYYDPALGSGIEALIRPNTRLVHTEAPGSNTMEMQDIRAIAEAAHRHDCVVTMDNTWATPLFFRPLDFGVDVSIHATTKYPSGHSDIIMGSVSANENTGRNCTRRRSRLAPAAHRMIPTRSYAGCAPWACAWRITRRARSRSPAGWKARRGGARASSGARKLSRTCNLEARLQGRKRRLFLCPESRERSTLQGKGACLPGCPVLVRPRLSWGGYESLAVHVNLNDRTICKAPSEGPGCDPAADRFGRSRLI